MLAFCMFASHVAALVDWRNLLLFSVRGHTRGLSRLETRSSCGPWVQDWDAREDTLFKIPF